MLKHIWESFAGLVAGMWERRDDDLLGTCIDRLMAMLVVVMVSIIVFMISASLFALADRPMILLSSTAIAAGIYLLTWAVAKAGEKVNKAKEAEYDRYISNSLKDEKRDGDAQYEQEKA